MARRPSFLFFICDQLRADHLGCYGNAVVRTPHIDAIAAGGWRADACYVASPICMSNRATLMTARMPSVHGVRTNGYGLDLASNTFVEALRGAGYRTALVGKSHLQNITGFAPLVPADPRERAGGEARLPAPGRYDQEQAPLWAGDPSRELDLPYYGFETVHLSIGHGDDQQGHYRRWLHERLPDTDALIGHANAFPTPEYELARHRQAWRTRVPEAFYPTAWCADRAIELLEQRQRDAAPFFILCSFPDPHHPFTPPGEYWSRHRPEDIELPASFGAAHRDLPLLARHLRDQAERSAAVKDGTEAFACTEREAREALALDYGMVGCIDDAVGRVMASLRRLNLEGDTVVAFTSDHGDLMGDHGLLLKSPLHYRGVLRVPLILNDPARAARGEASAGLTGTIDIGPTVLERAGVPAFNGMQGSSLLPLVDGKVSALRKALLVEQESQRRYAGFSPPMRMRTLVTASHRLTAYGGGEAGELFDWRTDPDERLNLWNDPGSRALRGELLLELAETMMAYADTSPFPTARA
jgi:arylsulfatase A-like enzyme